MDLAGGGDHIYVSVMKIKKLLQSGGNTQSILLLRIEYSKPIIACLAIPPHPMYRAGERASLSKCAISPPSRT